MSSVKSIMFLGQEKTFLKIQSTFKHRNDNFIKLREYLFLLFLSKYSKLLDGNLMRLLQVNDET